MGNKYGFITATLALVGICCAFADWGSAKVEKKNGIWVVSLENSLIKVAYRRHNQTDCIVNFYDKRSKTSLARCMDSRYYPGDPDYKIMDTAFVWKESSHFKTVYLKFLGQQAHRKQSVTIFRDEPFIRIEYYHGRHCYDGLQEPITYEVYGASEWAKLNEWESNYVKEYYNKSWDKPTDVLEYRNEMGIYGAYRPSSGAGIGWIVPFSREKMDWVKLFDHGFERWVTKTPYTAYYFSVTQGASEIISLGKEIIDRAIDSMAFSNVISEQEQTAFTHTPKNMGGAYLVTAHGRLWLRVSLSGSFVVRLYGSRGELLYRQTAQGPTEIRLPSKDIGLYVAEIQTPESRQISRAVLLRK